MDLSKTNRAGANFSHEKGIFTQKVRYLAYYLYWNLIRTNSKHVTMPKNLKSWFLYLMKLNVKGVLEKTIDSKSIWT